jgi:hypothetical protein
MQKSSDLTMLSGIFVNHSQRQVARNGFFTRNSEIPTWLGLTLNGMYLTI